MMTLDFVYLTARSRHAVWKERLLLMATALLLCLALGMEAKATEERDSGQAGDRPLLDKRNVTPIRQVA